MSEHAQVQSPPWFAFFRETDNEKYHFTENDPTVEKDEENDYEVENDSPLENDSTVGNDARPSENDHYVSHVSDDATGHVIATRTWPRGFRPSGHVTTQPTIISIPDTDDEEDGDLSPTFEPWTPAQRQNFEELYGNLQADNWRELLAAGHLQDEQEAIQEEAPISNLARRTPKRPREEIAEEDEDTQLAGIEYAIHHQPNQKIRRVATRVEIANSDGRGMTRNNPIVTIKVIASQNTYTVEARHLFVYLDDFPSGEKLQNVKRLIRHHDRSYVSVNAHGYDLLLDADTGSFFFFSEYAPLI